MTSISIQSVFLAFLLFLLGAATADALLDSPSMIPVIPFLGAEIWLLGTSMMEALKG